MTVTTKKFGNGKQQVILEWPARELKTPAGRSQARYVEKIMRNVAKELAKNEEKP